MMMHILCSTDANYIMPTGVMIKSVCINHVDKNICFHVIIDNGVDEYGKRCLTNIVKANERHSICFYSFDNSMLNQFPNIGVVKSDYITKATYYRLFVTNIVPNHIEKIIYLDSDIIVSKSLMSLWDYDITDFAIASVTDMSEDLQGYDRLGYDSSLGYFNAGVLVINLNYWRVHQITNVFGDIIISSPEKIKFHDQDILNIVFCKKKLYLPFNYNVQNGFLYKPEKMELNYQRYKCEIENAIKSPVIIHYTASIKPWHVECNNPLKNIWLEYLGMTQWKNIKIRRKYPYSFRTRIGNILRYMHVLPQLPQDESPYIQ